MHENKPVNLDRLESILFPSSVPRLRALASNGTIIDVSQHGKVIDANGIKLILDYNGRQWEPQQLYEYRTGYLLTTYFDERLMQYSIEQIARGKWSFDIIERVKYLPTLNGA